MTQVSMNKVSHAAFRRDLGRFATALSEFEDGDARRAGQLGNAWDFFDEMLHFHHTSEHEVVWPALVQLGVSPDLLETLDAEHETMAAALESADTAMRALRENATEANATAASAAVAALHEVTDRHLSHEEGELEQLLVDSAGSPEMKVVEKYFRSQPPSHGGSFLSWALNSEDDDAIASLRSTVPGPVLAIMTGIWGRRYRKNVASVWK